MQWDLDGKVVLVTGASSGIGRALAIAAGRAGARVVLVGRSAERLNEVSAAIDTDTLVLSAELTDPAQVDALPVQAIDLVLLPQNQPI